MNSGNVLTGQRSEVLVVGAGIVGVASAIWLQRSGAKVTLIDRIGPAGGTSYGNGGILAACAVVPVTVPGLLRKAPGLLLDPNQPLFLKWSYLPRLLPFLRHYLGQATLRSVEKTSVALTELLSDCTEQHLALSRGTPAEHFVKPGAYLFGYPDKEAFEKDTFAWDIRRKRGYTFHELTADDIAAHDPALAGRFGYGVLCPDHGLITDPGAYVAALAEHFQSEGGTLVIGEVTGFETQGKRVIAATTDMGRIKTDQVLIATGAWSSPLASEFGVRVPLESERGYHIEYVEPSITLKSPIMVSAGKFVVSSMNGRLRCAGVVEFGGLDAGPSRPPFELLRRQVSQLFPDLTYSDTVEWMGHRPATSDSVPVIGRAPNIENVYLGYGHQHIGLSGGPKTGRWLAQMITGQPVNTDLSAFSPARQA